MPFFEDVDSIRIVQRNIERLQAVEESRAKKMVRLMIQARESIRTRLTEVREDSYTEAQLEIALAQVDQILSEFRVKANALAYADSEIIIEQSVDDLAREVSKFSKEFQGLGVSIPVDQILTSLNSKNYLLNRYQSSVDSYTNGFRDFIERELGQAILSKEGNFRIVNRIADEWALKDWQIMRIVRTELHHIYNMAKNESMIQVKESTIPELQKALIHPMDARTGEDSKKADRLNLVVDIDQPFKYTFKGKERVFFTPPDRPNDRSIQVPYSKAWDN